MHTPKENKNETTHKRKQQKVSQTSKPQFVWQKIQKKGVRTIKVTINDAIKVVQFWCTKEDTEEPDFMNKINATFTQIAPSEKFKKVIYRSGNGDLLSATTELLRRNTPAHSMA